MKTLEELKQEMDTARAAWATYGVAWDTYDAAYDAYHKKLKELKEDLKIEDKKLKEKK